MKNEKGILIFVLLASVLISIVFYSHLNTPVVGTDDANIFFVYARNLAHGDGFVYNEGGERVEGFSSLLWVLINAVGYLLTDTPEILFLIINIFFFILLIHYGIKFIETELLHTEKSINNGLSWYSLFFVAGLLSSPGFFFWTTLSLMESGLWTLLLLMSGLEVLSEIGKEAGDSKTGNIRLPILLSSLILTRPEGIAWSLLFFFLYCYNRFPLTNKEKRKALISFLAIGCTSLTLFIFRIITFGEPLPNTYYAKVSPNLIYNVKIGAKYLEGFFKDNFLVAPLFIASAALFLIILLKKSAAEEHGFLKDKIQKRRLFSFSFMILFGVMIPVVTGGDCFGLFRFFQPIWPIFLLAAVQIVSGLNHYQGGWNLRRYNGISKYLVFLLFFLVFSQSMDMKWNRIFRSQPVTQVELARDGRAIGKRLKELFKETQPMVGVYCAGGIKYGYEGPVFDLLGLNHHEMAHTSGKRYGLKNHAAFNKAVFYKNPPQLLIPRLDERPELYLKRMSTFYYPLNSLETEERFQSFYSLAAIRLKGEHKGFICAYFQKDYLKKIIDSGKYEFLVF